MNNSHWIVLTNIGLGNVSHVRKMDCLGSTYLTQEIKEVIASILHSASQQILVKFYVLKQNDSSSCGLFAIASPTMLCNGLDPGRFSFHADQMREHLKGVSYK